MKLDEMIYLNNDRVIFKPNDQEYDITDYLQELRAELERLKAR